MSGNSETFLGVRDAIVRTFALRGDDVITPETTSADVPGWDSLSHSMLLMAIEEQFGVDLPLDRVFEARDVGELAAIVDEARAQS